MYTVKSGICVLSPDMFIGMQNKQEASCMRIYTSPWLYAKGREINILATLEDNYEKCPPLDQFLDTRLKQLEEVKMEFINEGLTSKRNLERNRNQNVWKNRCKDRTKQMEKVQRKKNVVVYNLPESEEEQARDRYKNTTVIFE